MSLKTTAKLTPDGKYYKLDGTKQFITNAGFADIIFTYAKVDGEKNDCVHFRERLRGSIHRGRGKEKWGFAVPRRAPYSSTALRCQ